MRILASGTGSTLPSLLEQHYVAEVAVLTDYESTLALLATKRYQALLAGDKTGSVEGLRELLDAAAQLDALRVVFLPSHRTAGFPLPDGVLLLPVDAGEADVASLLGLARRPLEGNRVFIAHTIKGGVGKSTATIVLAVALKQLFAGKRVVIWDLDLPKGQVGLAFGRPNALTIEHLVREAQITPEILSRHIYHDDRTGVDLLLAPARSEVVVQLTANTFHEILAQLRATYDFVLIDFEPEIQRNEVLMLALHEATDLLLITDNSEFATDALRRLLPILRALGVERKARIVFNNVNPRDKLTLDGLQQAYRGHTVVGIVAHDDEYEYAHRRHQPPTEKKLTEPFAEIARRLMEL